MSSKKFKNLKVVDITAFEKQADELFNQNKYRQAREIYKELVKVDKGKYFDKLLVCYLKHAEQLVMKGMDSEADEIYKHLEFLTGKPVHRASASAPQNFLRAPSIESAVITLVSQESSPVQKCTAADVLVLEFLPVNKLMECDELLNKHLLLIHGALEFVCTSEFDKVNELLQQIPSASPFSHWRLFIKGLCAYYSGNDQKAVASFTKIPTYSLIHPITETFLTLYNENTEQKDIHKNSTLLKSLSYLSGNSKIKDQLARAQYLFGTGRIIDAYFHLREKINTFPSLTDPFLSDLSNLFLENKRATEDGKISQYFQRLFDRITRGEPKNEDEKFLYLRFFLQMQDSYIIEKATVDIAFYVKRIFRDDILAEAAIYKYLAVLVKQTQNENYPAASISVIEMLLEKALNIDPHDQESWAMMISLYKENEKKAKLGKALDRMLKNFPDDFTALKTASSLYLEKQDYSKASKVLNQLHVINPHDSEIREVYAFTLIKDAVKTSRSKNPQKALPQIEKALAIAIDDINCLASKPYVKATMALICKQLGDTLKAQSCLDESRILLGKLRADFYVQCANTVYYGATDLMGLKEELEKEIRQLRGLGEIDFLWRMFRSLSIESRLISEQKVLESATETILINSAPSKEELRKLYLVYEQVPHRSTIFQKKISKLASKIHPQDLFFKLVKIELVNDYYMLPKDRKKIEKIIHDARSTNDTLTYQRGESFLEKNKQFDMPNIFDLTPEDLNNDKDAMNLLDELFNLEELPFDLPSGSRKKNRK